MRDRLIEKTFEWDLRSDPATLWPILSDTARLNDALGVQRYRISETFDNDSIRRRYGEVDEKGSRRRWEEPRFEWVEDGWWRWRRFYEDGPLGETGGILMLTPKPGGGTHVTYTLSVEPTGALGRILIASGHLRHAARNFEKLSKAADAHCIKPRGDFFSNLAAASIKRPVVQEIPNLTKRDEDVRLLSQLASWIAVAPLQDRKDLRSRRLAKCLGISATEALRAAMLGVLGGALTRRYRAVCSTCRIGTLEFETLSVIPPLLACRYCGSGYRRDFSYTIEALFSVVGTNTEAGSYCASGPSTARHIAVQQNVGAMERRDLAYQLPPGIYVARAFDGPVSDVFEIDHTTGVLIQLTDTGLSFASSETGSMIENRRKRDFTIVIERVAWAEDVLPVSDLLASQPFRDLAPNETLADGDAGSVGFGAVLGVGDLHTPLAPFAKGAVFEWGDGYYALAFTSVEDAVETGEALRRIHTDARFALDCGPMTASCSRGSLGYTGTVPETVRSLCLSAHRGVIATSPRAEAELAEAGIALVRHQDAIA